MSTPDTPTQSPELAAAAEAIAANQFFAVEVTELGTCPACGQRVALGNYVGSPHVVPFDLDGENHLHTCEAQPDIPRPIVAE